MKNTHYTHTHHIYIHNRTQSSDLGMKVLAKFGAQVSGVQLHGLAEHHHGHTKCWWMK